METSIFTTCVLHSYIYIYIFTLSNSIQRIRLGGIRIPVYSNEYISLNFILMVRCKR